MCLNMKTILFHQNISYKVKDVFVIDGVATESTGTSMQLEALSFLNNKRKLKKILFPNSLKEISSSVLEIYFGIDDMYIVSQSSTLDEGGRKIPFLYYTSSYADPEQTMKNLRDSVQKSGLQPNENDMRVIQWTLKIIPFEKKILLILSVLVFLILLITTLIK